MSPQESALINGLFVLLEPRKAMSKGEERFQELLKGLKEGTSNPLCLHSRRRTENSQKKKKKK